MVENEQTDDSVERRIVLKAIGKIILPTILSISLAVFLAYISILGQTKVEITPFSEQEGGLGAAGLNALVYVIAALLGASLLVILLKRGYGKILNAFMFFGMTLGGILLTGYFGLAVLVILNSLNLFFILTIISVLIGIGAAYALLKKNISNLYLQNAIILGYGGGLGAFLGIAMPTWSTILLLIGLSIYDIFAVTRGPIKQIIEYSEEKEVQMPAMTYSSSEEIEIGLGDLVFYSMLTAHTFLNFGSFPLVMVSGGILGGLMITLKLLEKRKMLPGLPISITFGLVALFLSLLLSGQFGLLQII
ncbi:presenilin family intramembrane aspartyl protease [Candidatus Borrarchaeum sp.]|uniref:presenilin family intramembrane aspartyl protease n=1 Tax=Candidatus Borrarchaeum sp. TaxID=2846742 RepID=UPI00257E0396|nr:presenilin family intramembrane aspartyl protease [Candidatus Borrarchaeum sp.]